MRKFAAFVVAGAMMATPALAQGAKFTWTELTVPDGSATVRIPCAKDAIDIETTENDGFNITCRVGPHVFNVVAGLPSTDEDSDGRVNTFNYLAEMAEAGFSKDGLITKGKLGSHRTLAIGCRAQDRSMCIMMIDRGARPPLALAYSGASEDFNDMPEGEQARVSKVIVEFANSVEMAD